MLNSVFNINNGWPLKEKKKYMRRKISKYFGNLQK